MPGIALIKNPIQEYRWGSRTFIPQLMGNPSPSEKPQAELWMGTHPNGTSTVLWEGRWSNLSEVIQKYPSGILGPSVSARFSSRLPFLFKVLAASRPLSIQVHPNRAQAFHGFEDENNRGIPLKAPHRNYRDPSHKPEILCALTPFWALKGFRTPREIRSLFRLMGIPASMLPHFQGEGEDALRSLFTSLLTMSRENRVGTVSTVLRAATVQAASNPICRWIISLQKEHPYDVGVLAPVLLNLLHLKPGEALSIAPGEIHSYLDGAGIELMANSDNVLRGGLTKKHVDPQELLRIASFFSGEGRILRPESKGSVEWLYETGAEEFLLSRISPEHGVFYESPVNRSVEIMICVEGEVEIWDIGTGDMIRLAPGCSILIPAFVKAYRLTGAGTLYKASVPAVEGGGVR